MFGFGLSGLLAAERVLVFLLVCLRVWVFCGDSGGLLFSFVFGWCGFCLEVCGFCPVWDWCFVFAWVSCIVCRWLDGLFWFVLSGCFDVVVAV